MTRQQKADRAYQRVVKAANRAYAEAMDAAQRAWDKAALEAMAAYKKVLEGGGKWGRKEARHAND